MTTAELLALLQAWRTQGRLRALDLAFAAFVHEGDRQAPASLLLAAALLAQLEGSGHSCLPLGEFLRAPRALLGWPGKTVAEEAVAKEAAAKEAAAKEASAREATAELDAALSLLPADADAARAAWGGSAVLQMAAEAERGATPLVLDGDRLYLRRYWRQEARVAAQVLARTQVAAAAPPAFDSARARQLLDRLFPAPAGAASSTVDWQKLACALALRGRLTLVTGGPGTGKTYTAARLLVLLQALHTGPQPLRVALAAPTGKAAARLRQSIDLALQDLQPQLQGGEGGADLQTWAAQLGPARTLHGLLGARPDTRRFRHDAANPLDVDLLFVDEASMVHLEMMAALLDAVPAAARIVLLGDKDQLASVEAGAVMGDLCQGAGAAAGGSPYDAATVAWLQALTGTALPAAAPSAASAAAQQTVVLRDSRRFAGPIGQLALAVNRGDGAAALQLLRGNVGTGRVPSAGSAASAASTASSTAATPPAAAAASLQLLQTRDPQAVATLAVHGRDGAPGGYRSCLQLLAQRPGEPAAFDAWALQLLQRYDGFRVLCALRDGPWGVSGLNAGIERALVEQRLLQRRGEWYAGRPVMVTRNDPALGVFNGDIGLVLQPPGGGPLRAYFADGAVLRSVAVGRLADVETAFAMTVHKSQGSEFGHVVLVLPDQDNPVLTRELVYTGVTRARQALTAVTADPQVLATACERLTRRLSGLRSRLGDTPEPPVHPALPLTATQPDLFD